MMMLAQLQLAQRGGLVKRFHVAPTLRQQNVAEHSYGVAWLVYLLSDGAPSVDLLMAALSHDVAECETGDLPAPAKRKLGISEQFAAYEQEVLDEVRMEPFYYKLTPEERTLLKFADSAELVLYCLHEISLGNSQMKVVLRRGLGYLYGLTPWTPAMAQLVQHIYLEADLHDNPKEHTE